MLVFFSLLCWLIVMFFRVLLSPEHLDPQTLAKHSNISSQLLSDLQSSWLGSKAPDPPFKGTPDPPAKVAPDPQFKGDSAFNSSSPSNPDNSTRNQYDPTIPSLNSIPSQDRSKKTNKTKNASIDISNDIDDARVVSSSSSIDFMSDASHISYGNIDNNPQQKIIEEVMELQQVMEQQQNGHNCNSIPTDDSLSGSSVTTAPSSHGSPCNGSSTTLPQSPTERRGLFVVPSVPEVPVVPDWDLVIGGYDHIDDYNWDNFLIQSEIPLIIRKLLGFSSETLYVEKEAKPGGGFQMLVTTVNWIVTHQSKFTLREEFTEDDLDGTSSVNMFYFIDNRTLAQTKVKPKWNLFLHRSFDKTGCNLTVVDRDRHIAARRFYTRIGS